jgi:cell division protein FtsB
VDAEQRLESLRSENTVLHLTIKHLNEKNELIEKSSKDS